MPRSQRNDNFSETKETEKSLVERISVLEARFETVNQLMRLINAEFNEIQEFKTEVLLPRLKALESQIEVLESKHSKTSSLK